MGFVAAHCWYCSTTRSRVHTVDSTCRALLVRRKSGCDLLPNTDLVQQHVIQAHAGICAAHNQQAWLCCTLLHAGDVGPEVVQLLPLCSTLVVPEGDRTACRGKQYTFIMRRPAQAADNVCIWKLAAVDGCICFQAEDSDALGDSRGTTSNMCRKCTTDRSSLGPSFGVMCTSKAHERQESCSVQLAACCVSCAFLKHQRLRFSKSHNILHTFSAVQHAIKLAST